MTFVRRFLSKKVAANVMPTYWLGEQLKLPQMTTIAHGLVEIAPVKKQKSETGEARIVFQGRLVTTKGARLLLEAARQLCGRQGKFALEFIGDGPERAVLEALAAHPPLKGRVHFAGRLGAEELEKALASADMLVVPSLGGEVFGLVVAENMKRRLPVIASDLGAFVEVLGGTGAIFKTGDARDLAKKIEDWIQNSAKLEMIADAAEARAEKCFGIQKMVEEHRSVYRNVLDR